MQSKHKLSTGWKRVLLALLLSLCSAQVVLADEWSLKDRDGIQYRLADEKGKWVLVNFWAPWCPTCLAEMPGLDALQKQHKDLLVIGVAVMYGKVQEVTDVIREKSLSYPIVFGNEDIASDFGGMNGLPTSFLYSPTGKLVGHHDGPITQNDIEQVMARTPASAALFSH